MDFPRLIFAQVVDADPLTYTVKVVELPAGGSNRPLPCYVLCDRSSAARATRPELPPVGSVGVVAFPGNSAMFGDAVWLGSVNYGAPRVAGAAGGGDLVLQGDPADKGAPQAWQHLSRRGTLTHVTGEEEALELVLGPEDPAPPPQVLEDLEGRTRPLPAPTGPRLRLKKQGRGVLLRLERQADLTLETEQGVRVEIRSQGGPARVTVSTPGGRSVTLDDGGAGTRVSDPVKIVLDAPQVEHAGAGDFLVLANKLLAAFNTHTHSLPGGPVSGTPLVPLSPPQIASLKNRGD